MPIGVRPTNDFAFKKVFGAPSSKPALLSLLNAILTPATPMVDLVIENPFSIQDFEDDKLSVLDVKATDSMGAVYNIEMQVDVIAALTKRIVFYACELCVGQLREGDDYANLRPSVSICLLDGGLWSDTPRLHHAFRLIDRDSGRELDDSLAIHMLELGKFNLAEAELATATPMQRWLYWLIHADEYEADALLRLFPDPAMRHATDTLARMSEVTEDKTMYDAREKARRDRQSALNDSFRKGRVEGEVKGEVKMILALQDLLNLPPTDEQQLRALDLDTLRNITADLQKRLRERIGN